jgi:hypothetical protein
MTSRAFDAVWLCGSQELERRTIQADNIDAALVAAWMDMPDISREDRKPCETIRLTDTANGQSVTEDVPPFTLPSRRIGMALLVFLAGCLALPVGIWMARHGWMNGSWMEGKATIYSLMGLPMGWTAAILVIAMGQQSRQDAVAQWKKDFGELRPAAAPDKPRLTRIVLAHYSPWRLLPRLVLGFAIVGALLWFPLASWLSSGHWQLWHPLLLGCGAALIPILAEPLRHMLFEHGAALWIQGGELVQCRFLNQWIPIWGIAAVAVGEFSPPKGFAYTAILLTGRDGEELPISPKGFRETPQEVAARLNGLLRLSPQPTLKAL